MSDHDFLANLKTVQLCSTLRKRRLVHNYGFSYLPLQWTIQKNLLERHLNVSFQFITIKIEVSNHDDGCIWRNGTDFKNASGEPKCCPIFENDGFLLSVMKMWVTKCIFLCSSTFYHVKLEKSQMSCLDMRFTKLSTKGVKKVFKLDVELFHQKQPNCKLDFLEITTENEN